MILLDTDVMIDYQRKYPPCVAWVDSQVEPLFLPGFVAMEMFQAARNKKELTASLAMVKKFETIWPSADDMMIAMENYYALHLKNGIGIIDALIAGTAVGFQSTLESFNLKHYKDYPGLQTHQPY